MSDASAPETPPPVPDLEYAIVEVFGHRRFYGVIAEVERFGAKLMRIDVLNADGSTKATQFYGGSAVFSITPTDRETVLGHARVYERPAVTYRSHPRDKIDDDQVDHDVAAVDDDDDPIDGDSGDEQEPPDETGSAPVT